MINQADVFQLFWSMHSMRSKYVEDEYRYALQLDKENFVRPVYWEKPMPSPPPELAALHFAYFDSREP